MYLSSKNLISRTPLANICWIIKSLALRYNFSEEKFDNGVYVRQWKITAGFSRSPETPSNTFIYILSIVSNSLPYPFRIFEQFKGFQTTWYHWLHVWDILVFIVVFVVSHFDHFAYFGTSFLLTKIVVDKRTNKDNSQNKFCNFPTYSHPLTLRGTILSWNSLLTCIDDALSALLCNVSLE